jgi:hypothetical protein
MKPPGRPGVKRRIANVGDHGWQHGDEEMDTHGLHGNGKEQKQRVSRVPTAPPG